jgi:pimeloyl-ACP methyl ester carboxylesterase
MNTRSILTAAAVVALAAPLSAQTGPVKNVVLVHGAFADGSGWQSVADILSKDGYSVSVVQEPLTSLADDVAATKRVLKMQQGPTILVGHSYGGVVITEAGNEPNVAGLVYIAAFIPDVGESAVGLLSKAAPANDAMRATEDDFLYLDPASFPADFAGDVPPAKANFMAHSQQMLAKAAAGAPVTVAAWREKKSWALIATLDHNLNPDLERMMAKRAGCETVEVPGSHAVYVSKPEEVARLIEKAAKASVQ